jgi:hypothetical protein
MRPTFSERIGAVRRVIQKDSMNDGLKNALWNLAYEILYSQSAMDLIKNTWRGGILKKLWTDHYDLPVDALDSHCYQALRAIRARYMAGGWASVYDFIEFMSDPGVLEARSDSYVAECNTILEKHLSAYRFVGSVIVPITSEAEIVAIEQAMSHGERFKPMVVHLETALARLADRPLPDSRNSIKESISAVEAVCQIITGDPKATLSKALKQIGLHPALEKGFNAIYGYTSDDSGIRHALSEASSVNADDAKFFLVACSAFANYLISKSVGDSTTG